MPVSTAEVWRTRIWAIVFVLGGLWISFTGKVRLVPKQPKLEGTYAYVVAVVLLVIGAILLLQTISFRRKYEDGVEE